jgi:plasmid stabilization system protein ParE
MAYQVQITARAERDSEEILSYLEQHSRNGAARWHSGLTKATRSLEEQPERYGLAPEAADLGIDLRQVLFGNRRGIYRVLFTVEGSTVNVLHIRHASRRSLKPGVL